MGYCINPDCQQRWNAQADGVCQTCGTNLLVNERFRLLRPLRPLSSRSLTDVFEAVDKQGRPKVLKVLKSQEPKLIELLQREASVLLALSQVPGIPKVERSDYFLVKLSNGHHLHCLAIEKIEGQNLEQWLERHKQLSQELALQWLLQLGEILDQVHQAGYFHRDIKPANIILQPDHQLTLVDFGAVRHVSETYLAKVSVKENTTGMSEFHDITIIRTTGYAPLEQINGKALPQSDFYALGRTFAHLMSGVPLHKLSEDPNTGALLWRLKAPQIAPPLADFVDWLMALVPGKRPQNTRVLLQYLRGRLPRQLGFYQMRRTLPFRIGMILLGAVAAVGVYQAHQLLYYYYYLFIGLNAQQSGLPGSVLDAQAYFQTALEFNQNGMSARVGLANAYRDQGKDNCALLEYQQVIAQDHRNGAAYYNLGVLYDQQNRFKQAKDAFAQAAAYGENQTGGVSNALARIMNRQKDYSAALPQAQQGVNLATTPQDKAVGLKNWGWAAFGLAAGQQGHFKQAEDDYQEARTNLEFSIRLDPTRPDTYCLLAQVQQAQGDQDGARGNWRECLQRNNSLDLPEVNQWREQVLQRISEPRKGVAP